MSPVGLLRRQCDVSRGGLRQKHLRIHRRYARLSVRRPCRILSLVVFLPERGAAVAISITLMGAVAWSNLWIFFVADLAGGLAAGLIFKSLNPEDKSNT